MVQVRLLGPVGVGAEGVEVPLGGGRQQALFAMLAAHTPPRRTDDQIVEGLWGENPPASARNAVQVYVSGLRKALAAVGLGIARDGDGYVLTGANIEVDGAAFETAVAQGRAALRAGSPADAVDHFTRASTMWGEPLDGLGDLTLAGPIRLHLTATRRVAMVELATALLRCGRYDDAVETATALLAEHPYDERAWVALATAHYWAGRQDDALATCRRARDTLAEELGVDPGPELATLEQQVLRHDLPDPAVAAEHEPAETPASAEEVPLRPLPPLPDHLVGRDEAVHQVLDLLDGGARLVTLLGIGGIGKTTLALAVAHHLRTDGRGIAVCELATETEAPAALEAVCRALGQEPGGDPVAAIASAAPEVLVLDNLEQIRDLSSDLSRLLQATDRVTIVATSRRPLHARGEHEYHVAPLTSTGDEWGSPAEQLFRSRARRVRTDVDGDPTAVRDLVTLLDGIPLAIELAAGRVRSQTPAQLLARLTARRSAILDMSDAVERPARQLSLRVVLEAAVDAASPHARAVLDVLAWCDGWLSQDTLEAVLGRTEPDGDAVAALDELVGSGVLAPPEQGRVRLSVPVREFVRGRSPHAEVGGVVADVLVELTEQLGPELAGEHATASLARLSADSDAITTLITRAVQDDEALPEAARVVLALRRYWLMTSRLPEIRRTLAALLGTGELDPITEARLGIMDGTVGQWLGLPDAVDVLERALADTERLGAPPDQLSVAGWCNLAAASASSGDAPRAHAALERARQEADVTRDGVLIGMVGDLLGFVASQLGDHAAAVEARLESLALARQARDELVLLERLVGLAEDLFEVGRDEESLAAAREAFDLLASLPASPSTAVAMAVGGMIETVAGDLHAGVGQALEALRFCRDRYPSSRLTADLLVVLAAARVTGQADVDAALLVGASDALRDEAGLEREGFQDGRAWGVAATARDRLGQEAWLVHTARGAADPDRVIARLLDGVPPVA